jgi:pimeloyl-ACP methyl ester carboxylesterase
MEAGMVKRSNGRRISFGDDVLEYDDHGRGEPILLLHAGVFSDWFGPVAAAEELKDFRIILPRRAGYVEGVVPSGHISLADHARHCASLLDGIGVHRAHVCGHSSSALIGLQLALDRPDLVHSLVLLEPAPGGGLNSPAHAAVVGEQIGAAMTAYAAGDTASGFERFMSAVGGPHHREVIEQVLGPEGYENAVRQSAFFPDEARAVWEWRFDGADAERIRAPLLVVQGEQTAQLSAVPPESVSLLAAMVPSAETAVLPGASHLMPLEDPAGVARLIADFARRHPIPYSVARK